MHHMEKKHKIPSIKAKFRFLTNLKCRKKEEKIQYAGQDIKKSQVSMMLTPERKDKKSSNESVYLPLSELVQKTVDLKPPAFDLLPSRKRLHPRRSYGKQTFLTAQDKKILQEKGFTVDKSISFGCSGSLYLMFYQPSKKTAATKLAVKVVDRALVAEKFIKKFLTREIAIVSELNHPHIIQCHSIMDVNTKCLFFMRFAENGDLLDYLGKTGVADETQGRMWVRQILLALDYLHKKLIAHRDIKCENLLVTQNLNIMLADFGFARKWVDADGEEVLSDTYCGSVSYAAPEILAGKPYCPKRVDVWSLGVVTFVMFNFAKPFPQKVHVEALRAQWSRNYRWNSKGNRVSGNAKAFVALMLEPKYTIRPFPYQLLDEFWMKEDPELLKLLPFKKSIK